MTIYCNIQNCGNWQGIEEEVRPPKGRGYIPIGDIGLFKGKCGLNKVDIVHKEFKGSGGSRRKLSICDNFSTEPGEVNQDFLRVSCSEKNCRFNTLEGGCNQIEWHNDLYIDEALVMDGNEQISVPACQSYILRKRTGLVSLYKYVNP